MKEYTFKELLQKAASYCSISEHCASEVAKKLTAWNVSLEQQKVLIEKLKEEDFINEQRYCKAFVNDKFRFTKWGKLKIAAALRGKGIAEDDITPALATIDEGEYDELLAVLLKSKLSSLKYTYEYEKQGKLYKFAQSRGFENSAIERVLRTL